MSVCHGSEQRVVWIRVADAFAGWSCRGCRGHGGGAGLESTAPQADNDGVGRRCGRCARAAWASVRAVRMRWRLYSRVCDGDDELDVRKQTPQLSLTCPSERLRLRETVVCLVLPSVHFSLFSFFLLRSPSSVTVARRSQSSSLFLSLFSQS